jgi:hypothetical protein
MLRRLDVLVMIAVVVGGFNYYILAFIWLYAAWLRIAFYLL